jgi:hypothetical protein
VLSAKYTPFVQSPTDQESVCYNLRTVQGQMCSSLIRVVSIPPRILDIGGDLVDLGDTVDIGEVQ